MKSCTLWRSLGAAVGLAALCGSALARPNEIVNLCPQGVASTAMDVNDQGQVVGTYTTADGTTVAFIWQAGALTTLYTSSAGPLTTNAAYCINNSGQIGGIADSVAAVWTTPSSYVALQAGGQEFVGVVQAVRNSAGLQAVGFTDQAFRSVGSVVSVLPDLGRGSHAMAINRDGVTTGYVGRPSGHGSVDAASSWNADGVLSVFGPPSVASRANTISDRGLVAGRVDHAAALWIGGTLTSIGAPCNAGAEAFHASIRDQVVGSIACPFDGLPSGGAFLFLEGHLTNLNRLIPNTADGAHWNHLDAAYAINAHDQIVGIGTYDGQSRAFLLTLCQADYNGDGAVNLTDFLTFLAAYAQGAPRADFTGDGVVNVMDLLAYIAIFARGC
jgi:probable HAF family extracellular repeat protein